MSSPATSAIEFHSLRLHAYFSRELKGMQLPFGAVHGDFSVSNILVDEHARITRVNRLGRRDDDGPLIVDAINYVESFHRSVSNDPVGVVIPQLAEGHFRSQREERFLLDLYDEYGIETAAHESLVYFKWLRHMAYLQQFWPRFDSIAIERFVRPVVDAILRQV